MDIKNFISAISQIAEEKGISTKKVLETIEAAIAAAYKKDYGKRGQMIKAKLDPKTGEAQFWQVKTVVDQDMIYSEKELQEAESPLQERSKESKTLSFEGEAKEGEEEKDKKVRFNPERHIMAEEAKKIDSKIGTGEELEIALEEKKDYGRIAAQTAKQVILQKIREAEKESIFVSYKSKEGEIISGVVQRIEGRNIFLDLGKTLGVLPKEEQVPGEFYRPGQRLKTYLLKVEETARGPVIILSRAYPKLVSKLFELEVPEISSGQIQIKAIAREAGSRTKISVAAKEEEVDPIGSMVGQKGTRVMAVINELAGEKVDIIEYSEEAEKYIANSLSPAKVLEVKMLPKNKAEVFVPGDQLSLAIGKDGQNVRLAAKLTGWKIDIRQFHEKGEREKGERDKEEEGGEEETKEGEEEKKEKKPKSKKKEKGEKEKKDSSGKAEKAKVKKKKEEEKAEEAEEGEEKEGREEKEEKEGEEGKEE